MGLEKIDFVWYIKRVSLWALVGYLGGAGVFVVQEKFFPHNSAQYGDEQVQTDDHGAAHGTVADSSEHDAAHHSATEPAASH